MSIHHEAVPPEELAARYQFSGSQSGSSRVRLWRATERTSGRPVIVKLLDRSAGVNAAEVRRRWSWVVEHRPRHTAEVCEFGEGPSGLQLVLYQPRGRLLRERLQEGPLPLGEALRVLAAVLEAVCDLHAGGLRHGALHPGNIVLPSMPGGKVVLLDIGAEGLAGGDSGSEAPDLDIARCLSPEQCGSLAHELGPPADLYSCGVLLYQMVAGQPPLDAADLSDLLLQQMTRDVASLRSLGIRVPQAVDEMVQRLLRRAPADRYQRATAVLHDTEALRAALGRGEQDPAFAIGCTDVRSTLAGPALVGRRDELAVAGQGLAAARHGRGGVTVLAGLGGVGKTHLLAEIAARAGACGMLVLEGRAEASAARPPVQAFAGVIAGLKRACRQDAEFAARIARHLGDHAATLVSYLPSAAGLWESAVGPQGPEAFGVQRVVLALGRLLEALAAEPSGVALLLDDVHESDEITAALLRDWSQRAAEGRGARLAVVATMLDEQPGGAAAPPGATLVPLGGLPQEAVGQLLESMAGPLPEAAVELTCRLAGGNPFVASALLSGLTESRVLHASQRGWEVESLDLEALRSSDQAASLLARRVDRLPPDALELLSVAAVLGRSFDLREAADLAGLNESQAAAAAGDAAERNLLWFDPAKQMCGFLHRRIRQELLDRLDADHCRELHLRAALQLEARQPDRVFDLAHHYDAAGQGAMAIPNALAAARQARQQYALEVARTQYEIARRWVDPTDRGAALEAAEGLGEVHLLTGCYESAERVLREAEQLAATPLEQSRIGLKLGEVRFKSGEIGEAAAAFEGALRHGGVWVPQHTAAMIVLLVWQVAVQAAHTLLPRPLVGRRGSRPSELERIRWRLLSRLAHTYWFGRGKLWTLLCHLRNLNAAEAYEATPELASAYSEHAPVMSLLRFFSRADRYSERSLEIRRQLGDLWGQGQSLHYRGVTQLAAGRFEHAVAYCREAVRLLGRTGDYWEMNMARYQIAAGLYRLGCLREAAEEAARMHRSGIELGDSQAAGISLDVLVRAGGLPPEGAIAAQAARQRHDAQSHAQTQLAAAVDALRRGQWETAVEVLEEAIRRCRAAGHLNTYISPCYAWLATVRRMEASAADRLDAVHYRRQVARARRAARHAYRISRRFPADQPHVLREWALTEAMAGRPARAARLLSRSLAVARRIGARYEELETLRAQARLAEARGQAAAAELRSSAERLESQLMTAGALEATADSAGGSLSLADRFRTVLESGRQIAAALSVEAVYSEARNAARRLLRGEQCTIVRLRQRGEDGQFEWHPHELAEAPLRREPDIAAHDELIRRAIGEGRAVVEHDVPAPPPEASAQPASALAVPIFVRGNPVACLLVTHDSICGLFGTDEQKLSDFVAVLAGTALENAEGFQQLQRLNETLEQRVAERTAAAEQRTIELVHSNLQLQQVADELRQTEEQLRRAIQEVHAASEAKSRFLAMMSHEIRTPLNGILGMAELAQRTKLGEQQAGYLATIKRSGDALLRLLNDLLDFSKIEAGRMELERIPMDPREVLGEVARLMSVPAWQKGLELVCHFDRRLPERLTGDPVRLSQIAVNLIGNAIKFTSQGHVELRVEWCGGTEATPDRWRIAVTDTGIGIPPETQDRIFASFAQADSTTTRRFGGTGLGLAISSELVALMGGTISVDSQPGCGSTFSIELPAEPLAGGEPTAAETPPALVRPLAGRLCLVVEPHPVARAAAVQYLREAGATVEESESVEGAAGGYDLVLLAVPDEAACAAARRPLAVEGAALLVAHPAGVAAEPDEDAASHSGAIQKPLLPGPLVDAALQLLGAGANPPADRQNPHRPLRILVAEDGIVNQEVIVGLLELGGHTAVVAGDGRAAVEAARSGAFDACLMDVDMPEMDGLQATRAIRALESQSGSARLPIIAMTAHGGGDFATKCMTAGMDDYFTKPVEPEALFRALGRATGATSRNPELLATATESS